MLSMRDPDQDPHLPYQTYIIQVHKFPLSYLVFNALGNIYPKRIIHTEGGSNLQTLTQLRAIVHRCCRRLRLCCWTQLSRCNCAGAEVLAGTNTHYPASCWPSSREGYPATGILLLVRPCQSYSPYPSLYTACHVVSSPSSVIQQNIFT